MRYLSKSRKWWSIIWNNKEDRAFSLSNNRGPVGGLLKKLYKNLYYQLNIQLSIPIIE